MKYNVCVNENLLLFFSTSVE